MQEQPGSMPEWELAARESIRDLIARYNANGDTGRFDQMIDLFAPDAVMDVGGQRYEGSGAIRTIFTSAAEQVRADADERKHRGGITPSGAVRPHLRHFTATHQIDVTSATTATSRCYFQVLMPHGLDHWGRYLDEFGVIDGRWRFTSRRVITDGATPGGFAAAQDLSST